MKIQFNQATDNIILIGPMAAGKTTIGKQLAQLLGRAFYDSDDEIEKRSGTNISWIFDVEGEAGFRDREEKMISELCKLSPIILSTGGGAIKLQNNRECLQRSGIVVYLAASVEKQLARTRNDNKRPLLRNATSKKALLEQLAKERNPIYESIAYLMVDTDHHKPKAVAAYILSQLGVTSHLK